MAFADLPPETKAAIRAKQAAKKRARKAGRAARARGGGSAAAAGAAGCCAGFPELITSDEYFAGAPGGLFRHPQIKASQSGVDLLLANLASSDGIASCSYFLFTGSDDECWDPVLNARLGYEGFFVITHSMEGGVTVPLPELQPYYGVLLWPNFERSKYVRRELSRLRRSHFPGPSSISAGDLNRRKDDASAAADTPTNSPALRRYKLINCANPSRTWQLLDAYHKARHSNNWLTKRYFDAMAAADADETVNFSVHCIEMYEEDADIDSALPLAGEVGFSIGRVYTSLSGWTQVRSACNYGTAQLCLLGRWLQKRMYAFWSLGHCYCPEMQYKRELGQRIFPRQDFLELLGRHRGPRFLIPPGCQKAGVESSGTGFCALLPGDVVAGIELLSPDGVGHVVPALMPPPPEIPKGKLPDPSGAASTAAVKSKSTTSKKQKPNERCSCGSGKKFKKCGKIGACQSKD